jgi:O-antigen/teichoic acid export membrane protein
LTGLLRSSAVLVFLSTLQAASVGALTGFEAFRRAAWVNIVGGLAGAQLMVLGALYFELAGAVWGLVAQALVSCIFSCWTLWRQARASGIELLTTHTFSLASGRSELPILWRFSLPAFLSSLLVGPVNWLCNTFLVRQSDGYGQVAILGAANQWKNAVGFLPLMFSCVLVPMLAGLHAEGRREAFGRVLKTQLVLNAGMCLLMSLPLMIFAHSLMSCYGPGFIQGVPVLVLTLISTSVIAVNNLLSRSMQSAGRAWLDLGFSAVWATVLISCCYVAVPIYGALGIAIGQLLAAAALAFWQWHLVRRTLLPGRPYAPPETATA